MRTFAFDFVSKSAISSYSSRRAAENFGNGLTIAANEEELAKSVISTRDMVELYNALSGAAINRFSDKTAGAKRLFALAEAKAIEYKEEEIMDNSTNEVTSGTASKGRGRPKGPPVDKILKAEKALKIAEEKAEKAAEAKAQKAAKASEEKAEKAAKASEAKAEKAAKASEAKAEKAVTKAAKEPKIKAEKTEGGGPRGRKSAFSGKTLSIPAGIEGNPRREGTFGNLSFAIVLNAGGSILYEDYINAGGRLNDLNWDVDHGFLVAK